MEPGNSQALHEASFLDKLYNNVIKFIVIRKVKKNQIKNSPFAEYLL